jgi:hypothetical protein
MDTGGSFPEIKRSGREADHSRPASTEVKKIGVTYQTDGGLPGFGHEIIRVRGTEYSRKEFVISFQVLTFVNSSAERRGGVCRQHRNSTVWYDSFAYGSYSRPEGCSLTWVFMKKLIRVMQLFSLFCFPPSVGDPRNHPKALRNSIHTVAIIYNS